MVICGYFKVVSLSEKDAQGNNSLARCTSEMNKDIEFSLFIPPYLRENVCSMSQGKIVFGFADTVMGKGVACMGIDCDTGYYQKSPYHFNNTVEVDKAVTMNDKLDVQSNITTKTGNVKASIGDCVATTVSLKNHMHTATLAVSVEGSAGVPPAALPVVAAGTATGTSNPPIP